MDLSIIIPVYNGAALIKRCLDSILTQNTQYTWEVLIVDDGSTDNSVALVESYGDLRFRVICQQNSGPAKARNVGIQEAKGRYLTFIDADDYWIEGYIQESVDFLDKHSECVAVSVVCKNIATGQKGVSYNPSSFWVRNGEGRVNDGAGHLVTASFVIDDFYAYWAKQCHVGTCSTTIRSEIARQVPMRVDLRISEDYEYWLLLATFGKWGLIPRALYVSDGGAVTKVQGWVSKMKKRWDNAPTTEIWEQRIIKCKPELDKNESYRLARGRVSRNLVYCQLLSGRVGLARSEALKYGAYFTKDQIGNILNMVKKNYFLWFITCKLLQYREYHRKL